MRKHLLKCSIHAALVALCLGTVGNGAGAGSLTRECAVRDREILMLIEERESTNTISAERLSDAMFMMMDARMICREGREAGALAIYDNIATSVTPSVNRGMPPTLTVNSP
jgi:hypothetical protein